MAVVQFMPTFRSHQKLHAHILLYTFQLHVACRNKLVEDLLQDLHWVMVHGGGGGALVNGAW
jgi:hypothetical protein